jgi:hypothetical protein
MHFNVGDRVSMSAGATGTVVGIIERQEYARNLEAWRWQSLTRGLIVLLDDGMFAHVREPDVGVRRLGEH